MEDIKEGDFVIDYRGEVSGSVVIIPLLIVSRSSR